MVLSTKDLGIREGLNPVFCSDCGYRIGWGDEDEFGDIRTPLFCEACARKPKESEDDT